ncbi:MAG: TIGR02206 family membrane protein [Planctomycetota bacterium]
MSLETFAPFTPMHGITLAWNLALGWLLIWWGLRLRRRDEATERRFRRRIGFVLLGINLLNVAFWAFLQPRVPGGEPFDPKNDLPLHVCDLAAFIAVWAFIAPNRLAHTLLYFWGLALSSSAYVVPVLTKGPAYLHYWSFWFGHLDIVAPALYVAIVAGFLPTWRDLLRGVLVTLGYVAVVLTVNIILDDGQSGGNYAYVGRTDDGPQAALGPWPWRLPVMFAIGGLIMVAAWAPWAVRRQVQRRRTASGAGDA